MEERREVLHAIERGLTLVASLWAVCVCVCACMGLCMPMSVRMYLLMYMSGRKHPHTTVCSRCLQLLVGVCNTHGEKRGMHKGEQRERGTQLNYK